MPAERKLIKPTAAELRRQRLKARERFLRGRRVEGDYARALRSVAKQVGAIVRGFVKTDNLSASIAQVREHLNRYAELLNPWAQAVATKMVAEVSRKDASAWVEHGRAMGRTLHRELATAPTGEALRGLLGEQVTLITSLPRRASERVHELTIKGITEATRAEDLVSKILETGKVTESRAMTIARTEVTRTASALTMVRAEHVGAEGYIWRTALDSDVRPLHRHLEGQFIRFDNPPIAGEDGERAHAGMIYNCRCFMEPVIPDVIQ